jgi:hypothetical protein
MVPTNPTLTAVLSIVYIAFFFVMLYIIGGMGDNIKKIRRLLEEEMKSRHGT